MAQKRSGRVGSYIATTTSGETVRAYLPPPLPPSPPLDLARLLTLIERANQALGRLDGMTAILPSTRLFVFMYVRKEALLSSQIEGTQSSLSDLLLFENQEVPLVPIDATKWVIRPRVCSIISSAVPSKWAFQFAGLLYWSG